MLVMPMLDWQRVFLPFSDGFSGWIASSPPTALIARGSVLRTGRDQMVTVEHIRSVQYCSYSFLRGYDDEGERREIAVPNSFLE